jgi:hypothetical protein
VTDVMLSGLDELFCHQTVSSFEQPSSTDRNWTDKGYIVAYDTTGKVMVAVGIGSYPNRNVFDGFAFVAVNGRQWNVRASRVLRPGFGSLSVGPIQWHIVDPPQTNRIVLTDNDQRVAFDVEFQGLFPPVAETGGATRINGIPVNDTIRYFQQATATGVVTVEGQSYDLSPATTYAYKDRSWGVRVMTGVAPENSFFFTESSAVPESGLQSPIPPIPGMLAGLFAFRFSGWSIFAAFGEGPTGQPMGSLGGGAGGYLVYPVGDPRPPVHAAVETMEWKFHSGTRRAISAEVTFALADGTSKTISTSPLDLTGYFRGGGYFGFRGWWQGKYHGDYAIAGESLDLTDTAVLDELYGCEEIAVSATCSGEQGFGVLEPFATGALPKYGIESHHLG